MNQLQIMISRQVILTTRPAPGILVHYVTAFLILGIKLC